MTLKKLLHRKAPPHTHTHTPFPSMGDDSRRLCPWRSLHDLQTSGSTDSRDLSAAGLFRISSWVVYRVHGPGEWLLILQASAFPDWEVCLPPAFLPPGAKAWIWRQLPCNCLPGLLQGLEIQCKDKVWNKQQRNVYKCAFLGSLWSKSPIRIHSLTLPAHFVC